MEQMGKYQLVRKLATGGMAEVFLAKAAGPMGFEKTLVVKRILPHLAEDEEFTHMFLAEAQLAARLNHANVVQIFDFGEQDGAYFIAMEYVEGPNLRTLARRAFQEGAPIPEPLCARILALACEGLAYAHELTSPQGEPLNLIHRDISTDNVLVSRTGGVKVVDFGIAKAANVGQRTRTGILKGKVAYMSPEHLLGKPMDGRADIYALGVVLYELLSGHKPFEAESDVQLVQAILHEQPADVRTLRADVPEAMAHIVAKALAKDREERYLSCRDLQADLEHFIFQCGQPMSARHISELVKRLVPILPGDGLEAAPPQKTPRSSSRADFQAPAPQGAPPPPQQRTPPPQQQQTPPPQRTPPPPQRTPPQQQTPPPQRTPPPPQQQQQQQTPPPQRTPPQQQQTPPPQRTPPPQQQRTPPPQQQQTPPPPQRTPPPQALPELPPLETRITAPQQVTASSAVTAPRTISGVRPAAEPTVTAAVTAPESATRILPGTLEAQHTEEAAPELPAEWDTPSEEGSEDPSDSAPTIAATDGLYPESVEVSRELWSAQPEEDWGAAVPPPAVPSESVIVSTGEMEAPRTVSAAHAAPQEPEEDSARLGEETRPAASGPQRRATRTATGETRALGAEGQPPPSGSSPRPAPRRPTGEPRALGAEARPPPSGSFPQPAPRRPTGEPQALGVEAPPPPSGRHRQAAPRSTTGEQQALGAEAQLPPSGRHRQAAPRSTTGEMRAPRTSSGVHAMSLAEEATAPQQLLTQPQHTAAGPHALPQPAEEEPRGNPLPSWLLPAAIGAGVAVLLLLIVAGIWMLQRPGVPGPPMPVALAKAAAAPAAAPPTTPTETPATAPAAAPATAPAQPPPAAMADPGSSPPPAAAAERTPAPPVDTTPPVSPPAPPRPVAKGLTLVLVESNLKGSVRINGKLIGDSPLEERVKPGTRVRIEVSGTDDGQRFGKTQLVTLKPGEEREVYFKFARQKVTILGRPADMKVLAIDGQQAAGDREVQLYEGKHQLKLLHAPTGKTYETTCEVKGRYCKYAVKLR